MSKGDSAQKPASESLNVDFMRSLVKQYSELGQWTSAFFWADAAAAAGSADGNASGDDIWLLASTLLSRGELHRAAHAVVSRGLHTSHLLCLGVVMRAYLAAREPATVLSYMDECDPALLEPRPQDQTHNRALCGVLVSRARALCALERRAAAADALRLALHADVASYEALHLLLEQHAYTQRQESDLIDSLPMNSQLGPAEEALLRAAYKDRMLRYAPPAPPAADTTPLISQIEEIRSRTAEGRASKARRLVSDCEWKEALAQLDGIDPWACPEVRAACLLELKKSSELFAFAHMLVDAYPQSWTSWFAVGLYYYLIGKSVFARRYLSKAKSLEAGAGCVWLAYGHSFAADSEHDQAMAAYFKASQLMPGCYLPPLYVGVECSLLNNVCMAQRFLLRAALLHAAQPEQAEKLEEEGGAASWAQIAGAVRSAHVAHEAGVAALAAGHAHDAMALLSRARDILADTYTEEQLPARWGALLDALGHAARARGEAAGALRWHERALAVRGARAGSLAAAALAAAAARRPLRAADLAHQALRRDPLDPTPAAILDAVLQDTDHQLDDEDIPQFPFPAVQLPKQSPRAAPPDAADAADATIVSDMSMSFD